MDKVPQSLIRWFEQQMPNITKSMEVAKISVPPIHVGGTNIKTFCPRIPSNPFTGEDLTIPRICCSADIIRALIGGRHNFDGMPKTVLSIYTFEERDIVRPSTSLTKEPNRNGEIWIVPHRLSNWDMKPDVVGEMRLFSMSESTGEKTFAMTVNREVNFDRGVTLKPECYYLVKITMPKSIEEDIPKIELEGPNNAYQRMYIDALKGYSVSF